MSTVSVVIVPGGSTGEAVRTMIASWTRAGITSRLLLVRSDDVVEMAPEPVRVTATLLDGDGESSIDLFSYLGRYRSDLVRIVLVHLVSGRDEVDPALSNLAVTVARAVQSALPLDPSGRPITSLHRTVLVVPVTGGTGVPTEVLIPSWDANVIISSEDRPDVDRPSVFVRASENFAGHAAAAICAAAGVIRGIPVGALDGVATDSSTSPDDVVVARVSIRTVVGEDVLDLLTRRALDPATLGPTGPAQVISWANAASDPDLIVRRAARTILTSPGWKASPVPQVESPDVAVQRAGRLAAEAAKFNLRTTAAVAAWTVSRGRDRLDAVATGVLAGEGSGSIVTVGPRVLGQVKELAGSVIEEQRRALDERLTYAASRGSQPPPATWSDLRELTLALADGSPLAGMDEPKQLGKREVLVPGDVVPAPGESFPLEDGSVLAATDPAGMRRYRDELGARIFAWRGEVAQLERTLDAVRDELGRLAYVAPAPVEQAGPELELELVEAELVEGDSAESPEQEQQEEPPAPVADPRVLELSTYAQQVEEELAARRTDLAHDQDREQRYSAWFTAVSGSVMWQVGDDVARRLEGHEAARRRFHESRGDVAAPAVAFLERARTKVLRLWWWTVPIAVVLLGILAYVATSVLEDPHWGWIAGIAGAIVVVAFGLLTWANHRFYKAFRLYERELGLVLAQQRHESETFLWAGKELVRLRVLMAGWRDWSTVIGEVLHRPWQAPADGFEDLPDDVVDRLPAAVAVARQEDEQRDLPPALIARTQREIYRQGWARQAFAEAYDHFSKRLGGGETTGYLDVDVDPVSTALTPRGQLVAFWQSGEARAHLGRAQHERLRALSHEGGLALPARVVRRIGPFSDAVALEEAEYFAPTTSSSTTFALDVFGSRARNEQRHYVRRSSLWLPRVALRNVVARDGELEEQQGRDARADVDIDSATASTALRVDLSRRVHPGMLTVFADGDARVDQPDVDGAGADGSEFADDGDGVRWSAASATRPIIEVGRSDHEGRRARRPGPAETREDGFV